MYNTILILYIHEKTNEIKIFMENLQATIVSIINRQLKTLISYKNKNNFDV